MSNSSGDVRSINPESARNEDEVVDIESVSPASSVAVKKMRGSIRKNGGELQIGCYHSRPKVSASKPSRPPRVSKKQRTAVDDSNNWAIVVYKPPPFPFSLLKNVQEGARRRLPKPNAVRDRVPGMRIRGSRVVPGTECLKGEQSIGASEKKRKNTGGIPLTLSSDSESERDVVKGAAPFRREVASAGSFEASTSKSAERSKTQVPNGDITNVDEEPKYASSDPRVRVKEILRLFDNLRRRFLCEEENRVKNSGKGTQKGKKDPEKGQRADLRAYTILKEKKYRVNGEDSILGEVPGVLVGDHFYYRLELYLLSLHRQTQGGIDFIPASKSTYLDETNSPVSVAVSVIASGGYADDKDEGDTLIYTGQGGNNYKGDKRQGTDQELVRGNLALKNSCDLGLPVRVIRGNEVKKSGGASPSGKIYYYDGLYDVESCYRDRGSSGNQVWKYKLVRRPGQGERASELVMFKGVSSKSLVGIRGAKVLLEDLSEGQEPLKVRVVGAEGDGLPERFQYTVKRKYPRSVKLEPAKTCSCTKECWDRCPCLKWNHGEPPYNENGSLVRGKKAIYECGPRCSCGSECYNRVSQKGLRFDLEVFKTKGKGWGVRSSSFIPQGSFICEYIGEVVHTSEAELRVSTDDYLFDLNLPKSMEGRFGDVSGLVEDTSDAGDEGEEDDPSKERWTIDAREYGNVARFINHSCDGNLFVQCVFYEHHDLRFPHIMLFAMEKISPYKELTYDYGYVVNSVEANGEQKVKECLCGARRCRGRLY